MDVSKQSGTPEAPGRSVEPEDAHRGMIAPLPHDNAEAKADRDMADAERAVAMGAASADQAAAVDRISDARTHEERRRLWLAPQN
jgi:hypothetical protein